MFQGSLPHLETNDLPNGFQLLQKADFEATISNLLLQILHLEVKEVNFVFAKVAQTLD